MPCIAQPPAATDPQELTGCRIEVLFRDRTWHAGIVSGYSPTTQRMTVLYDNDPDPKCVLRLRLAAAPCGASLTRNRRAYFPDKITFCVLATREQVQRELAQRAAAQASPDASESSDVHGDDGEQQEDVDELASSSSDSEDGDDVHSDRAGGPASDDDDSDEGANADASHVRLETD